MRRPSMTRSNDTTTSAPPPRHSCFPPSFLAVTVYYLIASNMGTSMAFFARTGIRRLGSRVTPPVFSSRIWKIPNVVLPTRVSLQSSRSSSSRTRLSNPTSENSNSSSPISFASTYHTPVMASECVEALLQSSTPPTEINNRSRVFIDATLGGGGHSAFILSQLLPGDVLLGCDVDPSALAEATSRLSKYCISDSNSKPSDLPFFLPVQSNFRDLSRTVTELRYPWNDETIVPSDGVDGILMDLGVSSHQIDTASRGFAFMKDGPLDMRMSQGTGGQTGLSAADICNVFSEADLTSLLKEYGDEPRARKIAKAIVMARPLTTTSDLLEVVGSVTPQFAKKGRRLGRMATCARVFQALRIVVNEEDKALTEALMEMAPTCIRHGGRLVVLSYHSMEDRFAKRVMRDGTVVRIGGRVREEKDMYGNPIGKAKPWKTVGKRRKATEEEVENNPRARSATLRVAERFIE